ECTSQIASNTAGMLEIRHAERRLNTALFPFKNGAFSQSLRKTANFRVRRTGVDLRGNTCFT
ncbi:MAG: hypothetical protein ACC742_11775, partial [Thermoanaerobaculales bacterium]